MADRGEKKAVRRKRGKKSSTDDEEKLNKDETEVAKYLRWNLKTKKSSMFGDEVFYFTGSKIVNFMLESKWATGKAKKSTVEFTDRESTYGILDKMIALGMFSRVHRTYKEKDKKGKEKKDEQKSIKDEKSDEKTKEAKDSPKVKKSKDNGKKEEKESKDGKKKKKVKVSLEPHEQNVFLDSDDAVFIWIFDPVHPKTFVLGIFLGYSQSPRAFISFLNFIFLQFFIPVIGAIAVCLFPLWPESFRVYSWYLSVAAMICIGLILFLAIFRYVIFCFLWAATFGKLKFWLLPNLTADCGFQESFIPVYEYEFDDDKCCEEKDVDDTDKKETEAGKNSEEFLPDEDGIKEDEGSSKEKVDSLDDKREGTKEHDCENNSSSNKDTDEGETWVKISKTDAAESSKSSEIQC